jgi:hypothetical protein
MACLARIFIQATLSVNAASAAHRSWQIGRTRQTVTVWLRECGCRSVAGANRGS